ncbi:hypothetical protein [Pseudomonas fluorescens]|uniref:BIG2 domain-containing protein n=1 Tax=Pseudomonas fluorescens TaxID=294 RepID=A0A423LLI2_PSEFL|nr:hypothetical protein [Pseudomonas fluorescens]RON69187.1 hypothetical protein BK671_07020 [Pseudomonas fluorescens]
MLEDIIDVLATLAAPKVKGEEDGKLDPHALPARTTVSLNLYAGIKQGDEVHLFIYLRGAPQTLIDKIKIRANQGDTEPFFLVDSSVFARYLGSSIVVRYEVWFASQRLHTSRELGLEVQAGFEGEQTLDLSTFNYLLVTDKPPQNPPAFSRFTREAKWGAEPYEYSSSDTKVAGVNQQAEVTITGNGTCDISATDRTGLTRKYQLTVSGIAQLHFLTATANWAGMRDACAVAGLQPASLAQLQKLLNIYSAHAGSLTDFFGRLPYPFWTGDLNGANTAWIVDLDKPQNDPLDPNPTSADLSELHQVLGVSMS